MITPTQASRSGRMEEHGQINRRLFERTNSEPSTERGDCTNLIMDLSSSLYNQESDLDREPLLPAVVDEESARQSPDRLTEVVVEEKISREEQARRDEEASLELARALQAEEAMASYMAAYEVSMDYLRNHQNEFSQEDLAALQAAVEEENIGNNGDEEEDTAEVSGMSYDALLRLGDQVGDVRLERWAMIAQEKIDALPLVSFNPEKSEKESSNDCHGTCLVCQEQYHTGESLRRLPCNHLFHADCVDQWLRSSDKCPFCRTSLNIE
jgi:hypothetical protein